MDLRRPTKPNIFLLVLSATIVAGSIGYALGHRDGRILPSFFALMIILVLMFLSRSLEKTTVSNDFLDSLVESLNEVLFVVDVWEMAKTFPHN